jgi:hypothetical protein
MGDPAKRQQLRAWMAASVIALGSIALTPGGAAAASVNCDYNGTNHQVTIKMVGDIGTRLIRTIEGHIKVAGAWCEGVATVFNTDTIVVSGDGGTQTLNLSMLNGGFRPGRTDEVGTSDEIEITTPLGGGFDMVVVEGNDAVQHLAFGKISTTFGTVRVINLNAYEFTGKDADVFMAGVEDASAFGNGGGDSITGDGGFGTGQPYDLRLTYFGGGGSDWLVGGIGNDRIYAGMGADDVWGLEGNDLIDLRDGVEENDAGVGGPGADHCELDPGDLCAP